MARVRRVSGSLLWALGMHSIVACGGKSSDNGEGVASSAGQSSSVAGASAEAAGSGGVGAAGMMGSGANAGASNGGASNGGASGTAGAACTDLANTAPALEETYVSGAPPAPTGGAVSDGTYFETAFVNYGATAVTPVPTHRFTARITNNRFFEAVYSDTDVSDGAEQRITFIFETSGTNFTAMRTCLNGNLTTGLVGFTGYDATPTTLTLHLPPQSNGGGVTYTLTKQ